MSQSHFHDSWWGYILIQMWIRIRSPADSPLLYCSVPERVNSPQKYNSSERLAKADVLNCLKHLYCQQNETRCSFLLFVVILIGSIKSLHFVLQFVLICRARVGSHWKSLAMSKDYGKNWLATRTRKDSSGLNRCAPMDWDLIRIG